MQCLLPGFSRTRCSSCGTGGGKDEEISQINKSDQIVFLNILKDFCQYPLEK
jgi:hypothetical protein